MIADIERALNLLGESRPLFHSEADFQHALAWTFHSLRPQASVRLEVPTLFRERRASIDLIFREGHETCFVELKYKTAIVSAAHGGEIFTLKNHGAKDLGSYDVIKDLCRVESFVEAVPGSSGCVIFVTNAPSYWNASQRGDTIDKDFQLIDGRELCGDLKWAAHAGSGSVKKREHVLSLMGSYRLAWKPYSQVSGMGATTFRYLCFQTAHKDLMPERDTNRLDLPHATQAKYKLPECETRSRAAVDTVRALPRDQREAILNALRALGGRGTPADVSEYVRDSWGMEIKDCRTVMADMVFNGNSSSTVPTNLRILKRVGRGIYEMAV